ncbi:hypothetical protein ACMSES_18430 [Bacteroides faecis]|uniref:hypothetical protein n=1 Tax=Bacteroides faecis TaxID=674529 RepID=UPI0039C07961
MERTELPDFFKELSTLVEDAHRYAKVAGVNFFKQNFRRQGFLDTSLTPWAKRSLTVGSDRGVLIQSGKLRDSIHAVNRGIDRIIYQTDPLAYAKIHNEGGYIVVTERMKRYFWYLYMKSTGTMQKKKNGELRKNKANARLSTMASFYKGMALKKSGQQDKDSETSVHG